MKYLSHKSQDTINFAKKMAKGFHGGEVLALIGDLGAGKTAFCRGLAQGLGIKRNINSPTFVIMKVYKIDRVNIKHFIHIDAYRLSSAQSLVDIGIQEYLGAKDAVVVIEWADRVKEILPLKTQIINFKHLEENKREIIIKNAGH